MSRDTSRSLTLPSPKRNASPQPTRSRPPAHTASSSLRKPILRPFLLAEDYRGRLPLWLSRYTGYRPPGSNPPYDPLPFPPFSWLIYIPLTVESLPPPDKLLWLGQEWVHCYDDRLGSQRDDAAGSRKIRAGVGTRAGEADGRDAAEVKRMKLDGEVLFIQTLETSQT